MSFTGSIGAVATVRPLNLLLAWLLNGSIEDALTCPVPKYVHGNIKLDIKCQIGMVSIYNVLV